jgi:hypothetical protein
VINIKDDDILVKFRIIYRMVFLIADVSNGSSYIYCPGCTDSTSDGAAITITVSIEGVQWFKV